MYPVTRHEKAGTVAGSLVGDLDLVEGTTTYRKTVSKPALLVTP